MAQNKIFRFFLCTVLIALLISVIGLTVSAKGQAVYIKTADEFSAAMSRREPVVYVDDIVFGEGSSFVALTYDVRIVGKEGGSTLSNVNFEVIGTQTENDKLTVSFENIIFDGRFDGASYEINEEKSYSEIFGSDRKRYRAFTVNTGYFDVSFCSCEFTGYSACDGAVLYNGSNDIVSNADKSISFTGCKFYGNISQYGTVVIGGERTNTSLENCEFFDNKAMSSAGCRIVNGKSQMTNVSVHDNAFLPFDYKENPDLLDAGGGLYLGGVGTYRHITVENNKSVRGGGICIIRSGSGNGEMTFADLILRNNTAILEGGGLYVQSMTGQSLRFFNCLFENNTTEGLGGVMYATPIAPFSGKYAAGLVDFTLCTFCQNTASDDKAFEFYELKHPEAQKGSIILRGCLVSDKTTLQEKSGEAPDYNFVGEGSMLPEKAAVPRKTVKEWAKGFGELKNKAFTVGYNEAIAFKEQKRAEGGAIAPAVPILYSVCLFVSVSMLACYLVFVKRKYMRLILMLTGVCIANAGYLCVSISKSLAEALLATRITYIGSTFLPLLFFLIVAFICRHRLHRAVSTGLVILSVLMLAASQCIGYSELFFTGATYGLDGGIVGLRRGYGVLYALYSGAVALFFLMSLGIAVYTAKKKRPAYFRCVEMVLLAGAINMAAWLMQRFIPLDFELLSVSFILTNGLLIFLYGEMTASGLWETVASVRATTRGAVGIAEEGAEEAERLAAADTARTTAENDGPAAERAEAERPAPIPNAEFDAPKGRKVYDVAGLQQICNQKLYEPLSTREAEVLLLLLEGRIKSIIAEMLGISENTVKTHVKKIYLKFGVTTRIQLLNKVNLWIEQ